MKKSKIVSIVSIFLILSLSSCDLLSKKQIFINPGEVGVYFDESVEKMVLLDEGNHNISKKAMFSVYSTRTKHYYENIVILTKDGKQVVCKIEYIYGLNLKKILELHREAGSDFEDIIIVPKINLGLRETLGKYNFEDIKADQIEAGMMSTLKNDVEFSKFIITFQCFILEIRPYKN